MHPIANYTNNYITIVVSTVLITAMRFIVMFVIYKNFV